MCSRASSRRPVDASIHAASRSAPARSRIGAASPAASRAARIRCAPRLSPRTIQAQPNPLTMLEREQRVVRRAPGQGGVDVGALGAGEGEVLGLAAAAHPLRGRSGRVGEPGGVRGERALGQPALGHRVERERADAVEQPVPNGRTFVVDDDERAARESPDDVDRRRRGDVERLEHELDRGERGAAGERGQRPQAALVVGEEQLVAPLDRGLQRAAALRPAAGRVAQHAEAVVEAAADLLDRQASSCAPRRARSPAAGRRASGTGRAPRRRRAAVPVARGGAAGEQLHGLGERKRRELEHGLAVDVERDLAGAQDPQPRGGVEEADRERRGGVERRARSCRGSPPRRRP